MQFKFQIKSWKWTFQQQDKHDGIENWEKLLSNSI